MDTLSTPIEKNLEITSEPAYEQVAYPQSSLENYYDSRNRKIAKEKTSVKFFSNDLQKFESFLLQNRGKTFLWDYNQKHYWCDSYSVEYNEVRENKLIGFITINLNRDVNYV